MITAAVAWTITAAVCFLFMRRTVFNFGDPLLFVNISVPFSAALLAFLCVTDLVPWEKLTLFSLVLLGFLSGARVATVFFGREELRRAIVRSVSHLSRTEIYTILCATAIITIVLATFAVQAGAQGDARQDFARAFRPVVTLHSGLFLFSLLALLSPRLSSWKVGIWLVLLVVPSIPFSGKSVLVPVFFWFGLRFFVNKRRANFTTIAMLVAVVLLGAGIMGLVAYGASSSAGVFLLIASRLWLSGDVYIYAYQRDALTLVRGEYNVSFLSYMLHPITSVIGIRGYEKPLGSMLASAAIKSDVLTGPNPQLPVLLDYFFPDQMAATILISFLIGGMVIGIRAMGVRLAEGRSRYLALGGIAAAIFCPAAGFTDTSQVLIALVGIVAVTACGATIELLVPRRPPKIASDVLPANKG